VNALFLEELISQGILEETLSNKKVGYYVGSFDPLHLGHEDVANLPIQNGLCDYVLIYPAWGGDNYKKRVGINLRHDMVFSAFADHPKVIVTRLSPQDMQRYLTKPSAQQSPEGKPMIEVAIPGLEFIGIVGSDTALAISKPEAARPFLTGLQVPEKYHNSTLGGLMALPAKTFIVAMRTGDDISSLNNSIIDRPIIAVIQSEKEQSLSSTRVKKALKAGEAIGRMVSPGVAKIITENGLYQG
jgi:nicotinic acid mononucleotide adenylyltransferase